MLVLRGINGYFCIKNKIMDIIVLKLRAGEYVVSIRASIVITGTH